MEWQDKDKLCRRNPDGKVRYGNLALGPTGFLVADFAPHPDGKIQTEIPNLMLTVKPDIVLKRPAGRPAAAQKKPAASTLDSEDEAEDKEAAAGEAETEEDEEAAAVEEIESEPEDEEAAAAEEVEGETEKEKAAAAEAPLAGPAKRPAASGLSHHTKKSSYSNERSRQQVQCRPAVGKSFKYKWADHGGEEGAKAKAKAWLEQERLQGR